MRKLVTVFLCMVLTVLQLNAQNRTITGKVTDADGKAIPGASVLVKGTKLGTSANEEGKFSISVNPSAKVLIFSGVGLLPQEVKIGTENSMNITLAPGDKSLDEVVVVGYQAVKRKDLNGAISTVSGKELAQKPIQNFTQLLQGKAAGVQVVGQSGQPGASGFIRVRGTGSINASSEPLIMIDGIAVTSTAFSLLNPNDIENVTVLKDASAAAIYGSRAGNGVIVVTTKSGKAGLPQVRYSFQRGFVSLQELPNVQLMNSQEKLQFEFEAGLVNPIIDSMILNRRTLGQLPATATLFNITPDQRQGLWDLASSRGAGDWRNYYLQNAKTESHEVSISGATDKMKYFFSLNKYDEDGLVYRNYRNRIGGRLNVEYKALEWLTTGVNLSTAYAKEYQTRELFNSQAPWTAYFLTNPYEPVYLPNGSYNLTMQGFSALEGQDNNTFFNNNLSAFATGFAEARFFKHLTIKSLVALNYNTLLAESYLQPGSNLANILGYNSKTDNGNQDLNTVFTNTATWKQTINNKHNINVLLGQEFTKRNFYSWLLENRNLPTVSVNTAENGSLPQRATTSRSQWSIISYFANVGYDYDRTYGVSLSARRDGSSRFGANNRFANFWAASAWWNAKNEKFLANNNTISDLKLRTSIGTSGNVPTQFYGSLGTYALNAVYNNASAAIPAQIANPDLTWEKNKNWDIGVDFGLFGNRITGTFDYYNRTTNDLLYNQPVSLATGFSSVLSNIGSIQNKGFEITLAGDIIRKKDFKWNVSVNYTNNKNVVTSLISDNVPSPSNTRLVIGQPQNTFFLVRWAGINPANGKNQYLKASDNSITETYSASDAVLQVGKSPLPTFYGSVNSNLTYKNWDFSMQFYYTGGNYTYNSQYQNNLADGGNSSVGFRPNYTAANNYWRKAGDIAQFPSITDPTQKQNLVTDKYLEKANYVTLRDIVIAYNLPVEIARKAKLNGVRFYVQGTNLWLNTKFNGLPEVGIQNRESGTPVQPGVSNLYGYPSSKAVTVGLDIRF
ncbi:MAG: TonB-dependent receptor [Sphingobacteriia bacterium]